MRPIVALLCLLVSASGLEAQSVPATPAPKKDPFAGWGTDLDHRPGAGAPSSTLHSGGLTAPGLKPPPASPAPVPGAASPAGGLRLSNDLQSPLDINSGGHSLEIKDLGAVLGAYGSAVDDEAAHPEVTIYPGISYLQPFAQAEAVLAPNARGGMHSATPIACGGFPPGLLSVSYDGNWGGRYNRLYLVKDRVGQVVCLEFVSERGAFNPFDLPFETPAGDWHVIDYLNARVKGRPNVQITTSVKDNRPSGHYIIVNSACPAMRQTSTWYVPEPLINLILYSASRSGAR